MYLKFGKRILYKDIPYRLSLKYRSNGTTLSSGISAYELPNWYAHEGFITPSFYTTNIISASDTDLSFQAREKCIFAN